MGQAFFENFHQCLSAPRMAAYYRHSDPKTNLAILSSYHYNLKLAEALYPAINILETCLRNAINNGLILKFKASDWYEDPSLQLNWKESTKLENAKNELGRIKVNYTPDDLIASLSFGFWTGLFSQHYENSLWRDKDLLKNVFPRASKYDRKRALISNKINPIRELRNRISHHEAIWRIPTLSTTHRDLHTIVKWINPDMSIYLNFIDRYPKIERDGASACAWELLDNVINFDCIYTVTP